MTRKNAFYIAPCSTMWDKDIEISCETLTYISFGFFPIWCSTMVIFANQVLSLFINYVSTTMVFCKWALCFMYIVSGHAANSSFWKAAMQLTYKNCRGTSTRRLNKIVHDGRCSCLCRDSLRYISTHISYICNCANIPQIYLSLFKRFLPTYDSFSNELFIILFLC